YLGVFVHSGHMQEVFFKDTCYLSVAFIVLLCFLLFLFHVVFHYVAVMGCRSTSKALVGGGGFCEVL
ncbi:hypothetical protein P3480_25695, partial [Vibrio parahaemolyticus]|nr:hypothetical protein [Vibrio parahaemolyticus]